MIIVGWVFASVAALVHILVFVWEVVLFHRPGVHAGIFAVPATDLRAVRLWSFNVGFYNLLLGCGFVVGVLSWAVLGQEVVGRTLLTYLGVFIMVAGTILFVSDRLAMGRPKGAGVSGALAQGVPGLLTVIAIWAG